MLSILSQEAETWSTKVVPTAKGEGVCEIVLADVADKPPGDMLHKSRIHVSEEIKGKGNGIELSLLSLIHTCTTAA